jgi:hypothetical protein
MHWLGILLLLIEGLVILGGTLVFFWLIIFLSEIGYWEDTLKTERQKGPSLSWYLDVDDIEKEKPSL